MKYKHDNPVDVLYEAECIAAFLDWAVGNLVTGNFEGQITPPEAMGMCFVIRYMHDLIKEAQKLCETE